MISLKPECTENGIYPLIGKIKKKILKGLIILKAVRY